ncbi:MAG: DUF4080 domain-containing protein [Clostridiales bacterium]|nr:DUF4080 domain-containing protein [Clostridiales bacterium]
MKNLLLTLNSKYSHSSLAIRYLSQYVRDESFCPEIKEYTINQHVDDIVRDIFNKEYKVIAFSCYIWNYEMTLKIAEDIKTIDPSIVIIFGGPEVSYQSNDILMEYAFIDYIIFGEGELTYKELCEYLFLKQGSLENIKGIAYRGEKVIKTEDRELIKDLDCVPFPYETLEGLEFRKLYYESSRGCPFNCQYCLSSTTGHVRYFSLERVKQDLKFFLDRHVEQVKFVDRTFNANPKRALEIMKFIVEHDNKKTNFHFEIVASLLDEETIEYLKDVRVGLFQFEIGVQSTNQETITAIKRNVEFDRISNSVKRLSAHKNIHLHLDLIAGLPFENLTTFLNSFEDVYALQPEKLQLGFLKLLKGSGLRLNAKDHNYVFSKQAPYEIFYNKYITFKELIDLKFLEEIVELYYNSNRFINSLDMVIKKHYNRAVDFYLEFADYWKTNGLFDQPHKLIKLYEILIQFYQDKSYEGLDQFKEVMKFDYYLNNQKTPSTVFNMKEEKSFHNACYDYLKTLSSREKSAKQWLKQVKFIMFKFDVLEYIASDYQDIKQTEQVLMYDYDVEYQVFYKSTYQDVTNLLINKE